MGFEPGERGTSEIDTLIRAGFVPWWFEGDESDARKAYLARRPDATAAGFQVQWDKIASHLAGNPRTPTQGSGWSLPLRGRCPFAVYLSGVEAPSGVRLKNTTDPNPPESDCV
jgi:hypothetical protein